MRTNLLDSAAATATAAAFTTLSAQCLGAIAVHIPKPAMAGGRLLPAGNYTVSTLQGMGVSPVLRFQGESGEPVVVMATREYLPMDDVAQQSEVMVAADGDNMLRVLKVAMEGDPFLFVLADFS